jgi:hypothetical protein
MAEQASGGPVDGVMITIGEVVFFVPQKDLQGYRLSDEARDAYLGSGEVEGFGRKTLPGGGLLEGVKFDKHNPKTLEHSSIESHGMTVIHK